MFLKAVAITFSTLGVGLVPKAPGTFGSLLALLIWWALPPQALLSQFSLILMAFIVGWFATYYYEKLNSKHDPKEVVVDELIGMWITLLGAAPKPSIFIAGFLLFRLFDIWKPFPIGWVDRKVPGALGTILDDVIAGIFAYLALQLLLLQGSPFGIFNN